MPRGTPSSKRTQGASNHRDSRNDNGLVGPGKRISKNKSQVPLNGNARSSPANDDASVPAVPTVAATSTPPTANGHAHKTPCDMAPDQKYPDSMRRASLGGYSESSSSESYQSHLGNGAASHDSHRRIDVNATKNSNVHRDPGPLEFALTVLRSCPLQDTIAILIILMQIPPIALSGIYMLFTLLTFVTTSNGLTLSDVFEWNLGAPSLATVVCVDGIVLLIWLFLWGPIQHVILDFAQMVIALGLGGGSSSRDGGSMKNTFICLSMILLSHILRHTKMENSPMGIVLGSSRSPDLDDVSEAARSLRGYDKVQSGWIGWARNILAIHILTQGLVKYIRDWYLRRERRDNLVHNPSDPEAGKSYAAENDNGFTTPDSDATPLQNPSNTLNTKKKRKQSAQIRSRQPLWAAIASTKIVVVKEYELSHAASESAGSNATDIHNLGNAPFNAKPQQVWISYVGCDEVCFSTSYFPEGVPDDDQGPGIDTSKPFFVKVNNAIWQPVRMTPLTSMEGGESRGTKWSGDIYGLTPMSNYECEFISTTTHEVLFSTSVRTTQATSTDPDTISAKPSAQRSLRPDSPVTTLKTSVAAAETRLAEEKSRQKTQRKENSRKVNAAKRENDKISAVVQSSGTGDDKLRQKIQQNLTQQKQAEQAMLGLEDELKEYETIPEALKSAWKAKQGTWNQEKAKYDGAVAAFKSFKTSIDKGVKTLEDEKSSLQAKRNKISTRIAKVENEHGRIADANARGLDEAERRRQAREAFENDIAGMERDLLGRIDESDGNVFRKEQDNMALKAQLDSFHNQQNAFAYSGPYEFPDAMGHFPQAGPTTQHPNEPAVPPPYDANAAWNNSLYSSSFCWGPSPLAPAFTPQSALTLQNTPPVKTRGRSSSMLSDVSGFTQSSGEDEPSTAVPPYLSQFPTGHGFTRQGSGEVGSDGSASSNSAKDPTSPP